VRVNSRRQRTVRELPDLVQSAPDSACVVIQLGVVDSAPRVFSERDVDVVREVYGEAAVSMLIHLARQHRDHLLRDRHMSTYVPLPAFETLLRESVAQAQARAQAVALVTIVTPSRNGAKMYGAPLSVNIAEYNDAIARLARETGAALFDADGRLWSYPDAPLCFSGDNYHYNTLGHERCAEGLSELLRDLLGKAGV
jgi:lysophospholipase L1-like esterase